MTNNREQSTLINHFRSNFPSRIQIVTKFLFKVVSHMTFKNIELNVVIIINYVCSISYEVFLNFLHMICASSQIKLKYKFNTVISGQ